jgi:NADP-dependent 3-hydroxy acid dehydrogenase YdfG
MIEHTSAFGRLDVAFNNAGVQSSAVETADASGEEFDRVNAINLRGVWNCMKYELRQMREQGSGAIVNCSSIGSLIGIAGRATYHASKHGVLGLTKSAALELELIEAESGRFEPDKLPDTYAETLRELLQAKVEQRAPQIEVATEGKAPKEVINIMAALKESMQAKGRAKVRDAVRRRMGKHAKEEQPRPKAPRPKPSPRRTAH